MPVKKPATPTKAAKTVAKAKRVRPALKMPKTLAGCADLLYTTKAERLEEQKRVNEIADDEKALKNYLIEQLPKGEASGVSGKLARATITKHPVPQITDEAALMAAIKRSPKKWGVLLKQVIDTAVLQEILDNGDQLPPGVGVFNILKVSLNKV